MSTRPPIPGIRYTASNGITVQRTSDGMILVGGAPMVVDPPERDVQAVREFRAFESFAYANVRSDSDPTPDEFDRFCDGIGSRITEQKTAYATLKIERVMPTSLFDSVSAIGWYVFDHDQDGRKVAAAGPFPYWIEADGARRDLINGRRAREGVAV